MEVDRKGIDCSMYQGEINWPLVKADGIAFAMIKATEGVGWTDPRIFINWRGARGAGLDAIAYHFWRAAYTAQQQATWFIAVVKQLVPAFRVGADGTMCDAEDTTASGNEVPALDAFMAAVAAGLKEPVDEDYLYSGLWWMQPHGLVGSDLGRYPLVLAAYQPQPPAAPAGWKQVAIWQSGDSGSVPGITGAVDTDEMLVDPAGTATTSAFPTGGSGGVFGATGCPLDPKRSDFAFVEPNGLITHGWFTIDVGASQEDLGAPTGGADPRFGASLCWTGGGTLEVFCVAKESGDVQIMQLGGGIAGEPRTAWEPLVVNGGGIMPAAPPPGPQGPAGPAGPAGGMTAAQDARVKSDLTSLIGDI